MRNKKTTYTIRRANLKERLNFLFTGQIPNYWMHIVRDFQDAMITALESPDSPMCKSFKNKPDLKKEIIDFLKLSGNCTYRNMEPYIRRRWVLFPEKDSLLKRLFSFNNDPDYFPEPIKIETDISLSNEYDRTNQIKKVVIRETQNNARENNHKAPGKIQFSGKKTKSDFFFTVNASGKKVRFAPGNLYWDGKEFRFEKHQYDYPAEWKPNHIGHFSWSKDTSKAVAPEYDDKGRKHSDKFFASDGRAIEGWTVLNKNEWKYLFKHALAKNSSGKNTITIAGVSCIVLIPDGFSGTVKDSYTAKEWAAAEAIYGLVSLPFAGFDYGSGFNDTGFNGLYWSSTPYSRDAEAVWCTYFNSDYASTYGRNRGYGYSVRLVSVL